MHLQRMTLILKNYQFKKVDIKNFAKLKKAILDFSPDYILNFAAESHVDNSIKDSSPFIYSNILGTFNLLEVSRGLKTNLKKFIHISTDEVFGSLKLNTKKNLQSNLFMIPVHLTQPQKHHLII